MALNLSGTTGIVTGNIAALQVTTATIADLNVTPGKLSQPMTLMTSQNATGLLVDFTGIPSWVKRFTVILNEVGTANTNGILIQIGDSGGNAPSGYISTSVNTDGAGGSAAISRTDGYVIKSISSIACSGLIQIANISGNTWIESHSCKVSTTTIIGGGGSKTLSAVLDRIRVTTVNASDPFTAGSINIMYEG